MQFSRFFVIIIIVKEDKKMTERKGSGTFLIIVSVLTLIVAIVGATFAYFTAQLSNDTPVEVQSYKFSAGMTVEQARPTTAKTDYKALIPLDDANVIKAVDENLNNCVDKNGYLVCKAYKITISNSGSAMSLTGKLTVKNNGFTNLKYQILDSNLQAISGSDATTITGTTDSNFKFDGGSDSFTVAEGTPELATDATYYLVLWLSNTDGAAQDDEQEKSFKGNIVFNSTAGGGQLKGDINLG